MAIISKGFRDTDPSIRGWSAEYAATHKPKWALRLLVVSLKMPQTSFSASKTLKALRVYQNELGPHMEQLKAYAEQLENIKKLEAYATKLGLEKQVPKQVMLSKDTSFLDEVNYLLEKISQQQSNEN